MTTLDLPLTAGGRCPGQIQPIPTSRAPDPSLHAPASPQAAFLDRPVSILSEAAPGNTRLRFHGIGMGVVCTEVNVGGCVDRVGLAGCAFSQSECLFWKVWLANVTPVKAPRYLVFPH